MKRQFQEYLINQGYSERTPTGRPSTVYDYQKRIDRVCEQEGITWNTISNHIDSIVVKYDTGGINEEYGNKSHRAVINALKAFQKFCNNIR